MVASSADGASGSVEPLALADADDEPEPPVTCSTAATRYSHWTPSPQTWVADWEPVGIESPVSDQLAELPQPAVVWHT